MLASSFFDPVLGLDVHFEMVPTPAPVPTPLPNPFIGIVFDPIGLACGIALGAAIGAVMGAPFQGPVLYWTAFPATNTGTEAKHVPGHILIPPGVAWAPFPKTPKPVIHPGETPTPALPVVPENDAVVVFGSKTVSVMGSNAVRLGDIALSCSEPLRLPSSVVLAIPKGAPILIGGPPSLDIMAAITASLRTRFMSDSLHALVSRLKPSRFRNLLHKGVCFFTGHPVDVASGKVVTEFVDAALPGPLPLKIERHYSSAFAARRGPLGHGWSLSLDQAIWRERGKAVVLAEDGREIEFDSFDLPGHRMEPGQELYNPIERLTLRCHYGDRWELIDHDGIRREYAPVAGRGDGRAMIQRVRSRCGFHEVHYHYGARGRLEWVRDSGGRNVGLVHDQGGRLIQLLLPQPEGEGHYRHRRYSYDEAGDLVAVEDSLGHSWRFAYVTHLLTRETDRTGLSFHFTYDGLGEDAWCVRTWGDGGLYDHVLAYDKHKKVTYVTNSLGYTTQYHMNLVGQVVKVVDPLGAETKYEYDPESLRRTAEVDALEQTTRYEYDSRGNCTAIEAADGTLVEIEFHPRFNDPTHVRDCQGQRWLWTYDNFGRAITYTDPLGATSSYAYERGELARVTSPTGRQVSFVKDTRHGQSMQLRTLAGASMQFEYDNLGQLRASTDANGARFTRAYDREGNLVEVRNPRGERWSFAYDAEDVMTSAGDGTRHIEMRNGGFHWLASEFEGGTEAHITRDTEGQIIAILNQHGERSEYTYDEVGNLIRERDFDDAITVYRHDRLGRMIESTDPDGRKISYEYDRRGRMITIAHGGKHERFSYYKDGTLAGGQNETASVLLERDALGRVIAETTTLRDGSKRSVHSFFDGEGQRVQVNSSDGHIHRLHYNQVGQLCGLEAPGTDWQVGLVRDATGHEVERRYANGCGVAWRRDICGRPVARDFSTSDAAIQTHYDWLPADRLAARHDSVQGSSFYRYDQLGRVTAARDAEGKLQIRHVDDVGNVYRLDDRGDRRYGKGGVIEEAEGTRYSHDRRGALVSIEDKDGHRTHLRWDAVGRLIAVERADGTKLQFEYDPFDRRVRKEVYRDEAEVPATVQGWLWDGDNPLAEYDEDGCHRTWVFDGENHAPFAQIDLRSGECISAVPDLLGNPEAWLDPSGRLVHRMEIDLFGHVDGEQGPAPFRWLGQYFDEDTGLSYQRFRWYSPELGRFISKDPLGFAAGLAPWAYVDDPLLASDPLGLVERFFRFVTEAEAKQSASNLGGNGQLNRRPQGQNGSTLSKGAKWITAEGAEPRLGKGTRPDWIITMTADDGTLAWLKKNGIDFDLVSGEAAAPKKVLIKANEVGSFGVGVDLLDEFNRRVNGRIEGGRVDGGKKKKGKKGKKCP